MTKDEEDVMLSTEVGQPVPAEYAYHANNKVVEIREDQFEEHFRVDYDTFMNFDLAPAADNEDTHFFSVQMIPQQCLCCWVYNPMAWPPLGDWVNKNGDLHS
jgi:hypothetical protein